MRGNVMPGAQDKISAAACVGGCSVVLHDRVRVSRWSGSRVEERARQVLGLTEHGDSELFFLACWPVQFRWPYRWNPSSYAEQLANARIVTARIEAFIANQSGFMAVDG